MDSGVGHEAIACRASPSTRSIRIGSTDSGIHHREESRAARSRPRGEALMGELAPDRILVIVMVALLLFGAKRLPEVGASLGKGIREFKRSISDPQDRAPISEETPPAAPG